MANIDPIRRAEIGREKRARTRAQLVAAASAQFARRAVESVIVDDVIREAGVAKGTFYIHFKDLHALIASVAEDMLRSIDDLLQPVRITINWLLDLYEICDDGNTFRFRGCSNGSYSCLHNRPDIYGLHHEMQFAGHDT